MKPTPTTGRPSSSLTATASPTATTWCTGWISRKPRCSRGYWPLYRYNPDLAKLGKNPLQLDSRAPSLPLEKYIYNETRYTMLTHSDPEAAKHLLKLAEEDVQNRWRDYQNLAAMPMNGAAKETK